MLNRFKNALYGNPSSSDDSSISSVYTDYKEAVLGKRIRGALTRSSSFREDLLNEVSKSRVDGGTSANVSTEQAGVSKLQRGRSQLLRKSSTIHEGDEQYSQDNNSTNQTTTTTTTTSSATKTSTSSKSSTNATTSGGSSTLFSLDKGRLSSVKQRGTVAAVAAAASSSLNKIQKFRYTRPEFLQLKTDDEIIVSADHQIRPIILPRDVSRLPWKSGYAECINAGKSATNEDQAASYQDVAMRRSAILSGSSSDGANSILDQIPWTYFGLFDGHAGSAVAVAAAAQLHTIISEKLRQVADLLIALEFDLDDSADESSLDSSTSTTNGFNEDTDEFEDCQSSPRRTGKGLSVDGAQDDNGDIGHDDDDESLENISSTELQSIVGAAFDSADASDDTNGANTNHDDSGGDNQEGERKEEDAEVPKKTKEEGAISSSASQDNDKDKDKSTKNGSSGKPEAEAPSETSQVEISGQEEKASSTQPQRFQHQSPRYKANDTFLPRMFDIQRNNITVESLIKGALESSFWEMDELIARDKLDYKMPGGCAVVVSLFILGKLYVCNAGDCRAIVCKDKRVIPMSFDFTPVSERQRILRLGMQRPDLLGKEFTHLEFIRRPTRKDLGKHMYYRDAYMTGWSLKEVTYDDLKFPLVWGEGKRSRVLATIGVTRGFGDHELRAQYGSVMIKPFLTPEPEVRLLDLEAEDAKKPLTAEDVLIMGTDGLWDVASNEEVAEIVERSLAPDNELARSKYRYISAAQDLIIHSRGSHSNDWNNNAWRMSGNDNKFASLDDISAFVIPLKAYRDEYLEWKRLRQEMIESRRLKRMERLRRRQIRRSSHLRDAARDAVLVSNRESGQISRKGGVCLSSSSSTL